MKAYTGSELKQIVHNATQIFVMVRDECGGNDYYQVDKGNMEESVGNLDDNLEYPMYRVSMSGSVLYWG